MSRENFENPNELSEQKPEFQPERGENITPLEQVRRKIMDVKAAIAQAKADTADGPIREARRLVPLYEELKGLEREELLLQKQSMQEKRTA